MYYKIDNEFPKLEKITSGIDLQNYTEKMIRQMQLLAKSRFDESMLREDLQFVFEVLRDEDLEKFNFTMKGINFNGTHLFGSLYEEQIKVFLEYDAERIAYICVLDFMAEQFEQSQF